MGKFNIVGSTGSPMTFPMAAGVTFQRGICGFFDNTGAITPVLANAQAIAGLVDDQRNTSNYIKQVNQVYIVSGVSITTGATAAFTYSTGLTLPATITSTYFGIAAGTTGSSWLLSYQAPGSTTWTSYTTASKISYAVSTSGVITITLALSHGLTPSGLYNFQITATYTSIVPNPYLGATNVVDMYGNDSTLGTTVANTNGLCSVYYLGALYETDQYDPLVSYVPGAFVYVLDGGILTTDGSQAVFTTTFAGGSPVRTPVGIVTKAPQASLNADQVIVSGQATPNPTTLQIMYSGAM
jgi:hypothetical protein